HRRCRGALAHGLRPYRSGRDYLQPCLETHVLVGLVVIVLGTNDTADRYAAPPIDMRRPADWQGSPTAGPVMCGHGRSAGVDPSTAPSSTRVRSGMKRERPGPSRRSLGRSLQAPGPTQA